MAGLKLNAVIALPMVLTLGLTYISSACAVELVPPGNRNATQPPIPGASKQRTAATKSTFDYKYEKIRDLIADDHDLQRKIRRVSKLYKIDPIHIVGALVGEHTYNVDVYDQLQTYYVKAISYAGETFRFSYDGVSVVDFVKKEQFKECNDLNGSDKIWDCREQVWEHTFRGKTVDGKNYPDNRFGAVFFQPFFAGQTFGLGQLNPLTALEQTDRVHEVSGLKKLNAANASDVYKTIMDPDLTLAYMAATIVQSIEDYRTIAGFDISKNPGLTATLYNLGNSAERASVLAKKNANRKKLGLPIILPQENYYGWLVNKHEDELRAIIDK